MKHEKKELIEKIESGEYYSEAKEWYLSTYIYRFIERSYLIVLAAFIGFLMFMTYSYYQEILPIQKSLPIRVEISDAAKEYTKITYLGNRQKNFDINKVMISYLSTRFVEAMESYDYRDNFKRLKKNAKIIEKLGIEGIQNFYQEKISIRNSDSFVLRFRKNVVRQVYIDSDKVEISDISESSDAYNKKYLINLNYRVVEIHKKNGPEESYWNAKLRVNFETIYYDYEKKSFNDLNFKVYEYENNKIR